jgi:hypothetical protein
MPAATDKNVDILVIRPVKNEQDKMTQADEGNAMVGNQMTLYNPLVIFLLYSIQMCSI